MTGDEMKTRTKRREASFYWLEMITGSCVMAAKRRRASMKEGDEILSIVVAASLRRNRSALSS